MTVSGETLSGYIRLYAVWERDPSLMGVERTITFNSMGGTHIIGDPRDPPDEHLLDVLAVDGFLTFLPFCYWPENDTDGLPLYVFAGWSFDNSPNRTVAIPPVNTWRSDPRLIYGDVTLYAVWVEALAVTFYPTGGKWPDNTSDPVRVAADIDGYVMYVPGFFGIPDNHPNRTDFDFMGWYTGINGTGTRFYATTQILQKLNVYAKWDGNETGFVYVIYKFNDGITLDSLSYLALSDLASSYLLTEPEIPINGKLTFCGWWLLEENAKSFLWDFNSHRVDMYMVIEEGVNVIYFIADWQAFILINRHVTQPLRRAAP